MYRQDESIKQLIESNTIRQLISLGVATCSLKRSSSLQVTNSFSGSSSLDDWSEEGRGLSSTHSSDWLKESKLICMTSCSAETYTCSLTGEQQLVTNQSDWTRVMWPDDTHSSLSRCQLVSWLSTASDSALSWVSWRSHDCNACWAFCRDSPSCSHCCFWRMWGKETRKGDKSLISIILLPVCATWKWVLTSFLQFLLQQTKSQISFRILQTVEFITSVSVSC